jgi:hypothetical protein
MATAIVVTARATVLEVVVASGAGLRLLFYSGGDGWAAFPQSQIVASGSFLDPG